MLELAGHERRVGDEQYRAALPLINISNEVDDRLGAVLVKSPRRLVRENELLVRDQRACDRDALLLSTAQLFRGSGLEPVESDPHEHGVDHASMPLLSTASFAATPLAMSALASSVRSNFLFYIF